MRITWYNFEKIFETCAIQGAPGDDPLNKCSNYAVVQRKVNGKMLFAASVSCQPQTTQVLSMINGSFITGANSQMISSRNGLVQRRIWRNYCNVCYFVEFKKIWIWFSCKISAIHMAEMPV